MELRFMHLYPDLMNLYGSYANVSALKRLLERLGHTVTVERIRPGDQADFAGADFVFMGAGTERAARAAMEDLARYAKPLRLAAEADTVMLFAGTAMELLGQTVTEADGRVYKCLGLGAFSTVHGKRRIVGDVYGRTNLCPGPIVGFMNKCGTVAGVDSPLLAELKMGFGNEKEGGPEGFWAKNLFGSELTGPILVKNPRMLEALADLICTRRRERLPEKMPEDPWAEQGWKVTEEQLKRLWSE